MRPTSRPPPLLIRGTVVDATEPVQVKLEPSSEESCVRSLQSPDVELVRTCWSPDEELVAVVWSDKDGAFAFEALHKVGSKRRYPIRSDCPYRLTVFADRISPVLICASSGLLPLQLHIKPPPRPRIPVSDGVPFATQPAKP